MVSPRRPRRKPGSTSAAAPRTARPRDRAFDARRFLPALGVVGLLAVHATLAATSIRHKSATFDEVAHLTKGHAFWRLEDNRLLPEHPPLAQAWAALPLLDDGLRFPGREQQAWYHSAIFTLGKQFFYRMGNDPDAMLRQARGMIILLSLATGVVVFWWSRRLFGTAGGYVALILYTFSPTVLAHGRLVTTDMCVSLFFLLAVGGVWWVLHRLSPLSVLAGALALAGLFLSKMSAVLIVPMGLGLMIIRLISRAPLPVRLGQERSLGRRWKMTLAIGVVMGFFVLFVGLAIWAAADFRYEAMTNAEPGRDRFFVPGTLPEGKDVWEHQGRGIPTTATAINWTRERHLLPENYLYGFLFTMQSARGRDAFLNGDRNLTGWWYFFPLCFLYKVPLSIMGIIVAAFMAVFGKFGGPMIEAQSTGVSSSRRLGATLYHTSPLWVLIIVYWVFAVTSNLNIGHRHLLPTFAPMFILCGAAASWLKVSRKIFQAAVPILLGLLIITSVITWPHYLAYFNTIAGGPSQGYRHLVDSSLDWGQDLPGLKEWLDENRGDQQAYLAYFGTGNWAHYRIEASPLPHYLRASGTGDYHLTGGLYCISATRLQQVYMLKPTRWTEDLEKRYRRYLPEMLEFQEAPDDQEIRGALLRSKGKGFKKRFDDFQKLRFGKLCAYLRRGEPDDHVGHSILIYRLTDADLHEALSEGGHGTAEGQRPGTSSFHARPQQAGTRP